MTGRLDVLVVGGTGVDTIVRVDSHPVPYADSVPVPPIRDWVGNTGNAVALACHTLGMATTLIDFLGEDTQGALVRAEYARRGLDFAWLPNPAGTTRSVNLVDATGRRQSFFDPRHPGRDLPRDFYLPYVERARHVHVTISDYAAGVFDDVGPGVSTSTDLHDWDGVNPYHRRFALRADLVFLSAVALGERRGEVMRAIRDEGRASVVVATSGARGVDVLDDDGPRHFPAVDPPGPVVDSNGAGDSFVAAFLWARARGGETDDCVRAGLVGGAFACTSEGTASAFIDATTLGGSLPGG
ncbi:carbohydrate kinase family protein [Phytomonospora endophytica]|uniref:Sugar/nucleoside kinase (Ribokinase family) n=1 Tax=Phytomonospora endophytica TaxID=714109 RepID=A0A841FSR3_9ACTN|nr:PfkB family carbohydrate kinase [Phytomonospora endophytica]MBB6039076.1 sugar/nucleoside kinase (ribokinase family) [Phytomonospora endophytica]